MVTLTGTCLYLGPADFARGKEVCGLRLDAKRTTTDCDGKYRGERYFRCTPGHGLYIPLEDAEFLAVATDAEYEQVEGIYMYIHAYVYMYIYIYTCVCKCIYLYICMYVCVYMFIYIYIHVYIYIHTHK